MTTEMPNPYASIYVQAIGSASCRGGCGARPPQLLILIEKGRESHIFANCPNTGLYGAGPDSDIERVKDEMSDVSPKYISGKRESELVDAILAEKARIGIKKRSDIMTRAIDDLLDLIDS